MKMNKTLHFHLLPSAVFIVVTFFLTRNTSAILPKDFFQTISPPRLLPEIHNVYSMETFYEEELLIGKYISCTYEEKLCFHYNTLYEPKKRRCLLSLKEWCHLVPVHRIDSIKKGHGNLFAMCPDDKNFCSEPQVSRPTICNKARARHISCSCNAKPTLLIFGEVGCRCWSNSVVNVSQPSEKGRCRIPFLFYPESSKSRLKVISSSDLLVPELRLECSEEQRRCFSLGKVWMPGKAGCFRLLERDPCPKGHIVALNASQARQRNVEVICVEKRGGCPAKQIRMLFDGQCHKKRDMKLLSASPIFHTLYGQYHGFPSDLCLKKSVWALNASNTVSARTCVVHHSTFPKINETRCREPNMGQQNTSISAVLESRGSDKLTQTNGVSVPPQSMATAPIGIKGFERFHANDTFIGIPVACTFKEKICFRYNTLFNPKTDRCLDETMAGDKKEFLYGSGHLFAREHSPDPCPGYRMAYDGRCYPKDIVHDVICGCDAEPTPHFLGGWECRCSPSTPVHVEQPKEEGRCRIPDLRFPDYFRSQMRNESWRDNFNGDKCSDEQRRCFLKESVWLDFANNCFKLNIRGPCPQNHLVVLTKENFLYGTAVCKRFSNGCETGFIRLARDGKCHDQRMVMVTRPNSTVIYRNMFGEYYVEDERHSEVQPSAGFSPGSCIFNVKSVKSHSSEICELGCSATSGTQGWDHIARPECGPNDHNRCELYEVEANEPYAEI